MASARSRGIRRAGGPVPLAVIGALLWGIAVHATAVETLDGTAVRILSGDTLEVGVGDRIIELRLADIGAPQGSEYYAPPAQTLLSNIALDQKLRVTVTGRSDAGGTYGRVSVGKLDVNLELVRRGAAWVCWEYGAPSSLLPYETEAKRFQRGLWVYTLEIDARVACKRRPPSP